MGLRCHEISPLVKPLPTCTKGMGLEIPERLQLQLAGKLEGITGSFGLPDRRHLRERMKNILPAEYEKLYYDQLEGQPWWLDPNWIASWIPRWIY